MRKHNLSRSELPYLYCVYDMIVQIYSKIIVRDLSKTRTSEVTDEHGLKEILRTETKSIFGAKGPSSVQVDSLGPLVPNMDLGSVHLNFSQLASFLSPKYGFGVVREKF